MQKLFSTVLFVLLSGTASAASVVVDFEEQPLISTSDPAFSLTSQGYLFESVMATTDPTDPQLGNRTLVFCPGCTLSLTHAEGKRFSISAADFADYGSFPAGGLVLTGYLASGGTISTTVARTGSLQTYNFDAAWSGLTQVDIGPAGEQLFGLGVDNIALTAVPVPATVWLLGSALAGLGWMRRKRIA